MRIWNHLDNHDRGSCSTEGAWFGSRAPGLAISMCPTRRRGKDIAATFCSSPRRLVLPCASGRIRGVSTHPPDSPQTAMNAHKAPKRNKAAAR